MNTDTREAHEEVRGSDGIIRGFITLREGGRYFTYCAAVHSTDEDNGPIVERNYARGGVADLPFLDKVRGELARIPLEELSEEFIANEENDS